MRNRLGIVLAGLALGLAGCAASQTLENLPESIGGLPADAPARPEKAYQYPAVHDMPQPRAVKPLSDDELLKLQNDLKAARDKQEQAAGAPAAQAAAPPPAKPPTQPKKRAADKAGKAEKDKAGGADKP